MFTSMCFCSTTDQEVPWAAVCAVAPGRDAGVAGAWGGGGGGGGRALVGAGGGGGGGARAWGRTSGAGGGVRAGGARTPWNPQRPQPPGRRALAIATAR